MRTRLLIGLCLAFAAMAATAPEKTTVSIVGDAFHINGAPTYAGRACVLGVVRDITERVRAYQRLEERVAERTRELSTLLEPLAAEFQVLARNRGLDLRLARSGAVVRTDGRQ